VLLLVVRWATVRLSERGPQQGAPTPLRRLTASIGRRSYSIMLVVALYAASTVLTVPDYVERVVHGVIALALVVQGGLWRQAVIAWALDWWDARGPGFAVSGISEAVGHVGRLALWSLLVVFALNNLGVEVRALVAAPGIGALALALAARTVLADLLASLVIVLDRPFTKGDVVGVGDMSGTIERIGVKTTHVRSLSGELLVLSNSDVLGSPIRNFGRMEKRRVALALGVPYHTALEQVEAIPGMIRGAVERQSQARFARAHFRG